MTTSFAPLGNFTGGPVLGTSPHQYCGSIGYQSAPITPPPGHIANGTNGGSPQAGAHTQGAATCTSFPVDHQPLHHGPPPGPLPEGAAPGLSPPMGHQWPPSQDQGSGQPAGVLDMMQALTQSSVMTANALQQMGGFIAEESTKRQANQGYRSLKPKRDVTQIRCNDAPTFMEEIMCFETDLHELGVTTTGEAAFFQLRAVAIDHGRDVLDFALSREPMFPLHTQAMSAQTGDKLLPNGEPGRGYVRATCFEALYQYAIIELKKSVNLTEEKVVDMATKKRDAAKMRGNTVSDARQFLRDLLKGRLALSRAKNLSPGPEWLDSAEGYNMQRSCTEPVYAWMRQELISRSNEDVKQFMGSVSLQVRDWINNRTRNSQEGN
jgi:hypothetical protein